MLSQILVDDQRQAHESASGVPGRVLSELISRGGDAIYSLLRRGMDDVQDNISDVRENVKRWMQAPRELDAREITRTVNQAVERVLRAIDIPTRGDLEALNKNLERLSNALESIESRLNRVETAQRQP